MVREELNSLQRKGEEKNGGERLHILKSREVTQNIKLIILTL